MTGYMVEEKEGAKMIPYTLTKEDCERSIEYLNRVTVPDKIKEDAEQLLEDLVDILKRNRFQCDTHPNLDKGKHPGWGVRYTEKAYISAEFPEEKAKILDIVLENIYKEKRRASKETLTHEKIG